jgi:hypothetical protein
MGNYFFLDADSSDIHVEGKPIQQHLRHVLDSSAVFLDTENEKERHTSLFDCLRMSGSFVTSDCLALSDLVVEVSLICCSFPSFA